MHRINRLFVYGIFLDEDMRNAYGMSNPEYATVKNYLTVSRSKQIVQAVEVDPLFNAELTGLTVDVDPIYWDKIDNLERGYRRNVVITSDGEAVNMYTA